MLTTMRRGLVARHAFQSTAVLAPATQFHAVRRGLASISVLETLTANDVATRPVKMCRPDANITEALAMLGGGKLGALIVQEPGDGHKNAQLHGVITERDFLVKMAMDEGTRFAMFEPTIGDLMTKAESMTFAEPGWTLMHCLQVMLDGGFRHLPITEMGSVTAMLSLKDITRAMVNDEASPSHELSETVGGIAMAAMARQVDTVGGLELPPSIASVTRGATVAEAVALMRARRVGSVLVPSRGETLAASLHNFSIFTERDLLKLLITAADEQTDPRQLSVAQFATPSDRLVWVKPEVSALDAISMMAAKCARSTPTSHSLLVGLISPD